MKTRTVDLASPEFYVNRELSLLEFIRRVLEQAKDATLPLLERLFFLCIFSRNLDEFLEIRVSGLRSGSRSDCCADGLVGKAARRCVWIHARRPLGAFIGAALGHNFDAGMGSSAGRRADSSPFESRERAQTAFFTATFSVMGHIAKADGRVSEDELRLAASVMEQMGLDGRLRHSSRNACSTRVSRRTFRSTRSLSSFGSSAGIVGICSACSSRFSSPPRMPTDGWTGRSGECSNTSASGWGYRQAS